MIAVPLQFTVRSGTVLDAVARIAGLAIIAAAVAGAVAIAYRWYARERVSNPPAVLLAVAIVAAYLNATTALGEVMNGAAALSVRAAVFNVSGLVAGTLAGLLGVSVGDRLARIVLGGTRDIAVEGSLNRVVRAVGRVIAVELPAEIDDVPGYDPVDPETKATLGGKTFVFPRGLTVEELRERLRRRLREDYRVGHVDIDIDADGTVTHLGLGSRAAGIGPTLPPESAAIAVRADPAYAASAGDVVQVWERDPSQRVCNAEVRGTAGEIVTLAIDAADASKLDPEGRYKLVTLPVDERADRELADLLRAAEETLGVVEIGPGAALAGAPIAALDVTVVAIHGGGPDTRIEALPPGDRVLEVGDSVYVIARPDAIRRLESGANATADAASADSPPPDIADVSDDPPDRDLSQSSDDPDDIDSEPSTAGEGMETEDDETPAESETELEAADENVADEDDASERPGDSESA